MKVRHIQEEDLNELAIIYTKVYKKLNIGEKWNKSSSLKMLKHIFNKNKDLSFLIEDNNIILGAFLVDIKPWWDGNHLIDGEIFIDTKYQKKGYGTHILKYVFEYAINKYEVVSWDSFTFIKSKHPWSWYKKIGFEENNEWKAFWGEPKEIVKNIETQNKNLKNEN